LNRLFTALIMQERVADAFRGLPDEQGYIKGERELARTKRVTAKKKQELERNQELVYETFRKLNIVNGTKFELVVKDIFERLNQTRQEPPSMVTIRRYLKDDAKIMDCFKYEGRNWVYLWPGLEHYL
jgi:hypothetical protein